MEEALKKYFELYLATWRDYKKSLPMVPYDESINTCLYVGEMDEDEYIAWKPKKKDVLSNFTEIEEKYGVEINQIIKDYFNAYWFLELKGFINDKCVSLESVIPGMELDNIRNQIDGYFQLFNNINYIPIGIETTTSDLIVVDNKTGEIYYQNVDSGEIEYASKSLNEFIGEIRFGRN